MNQDNEKKNLKNKRKISRILRLLTKGHREVVVEDQGNDPRID